MNRKLAALAAVILGAMLCVGATASAGPCAGCNLHIAFVKGNGLGDTVWLGDGLGHHARKLGSGDEPLLSPAGDQVGVSLNGRGAALAIYAPGRRTRRYFKTAQVGVQPLAWSPESRYLAVALFSNNPGKGDRQSGLAVVDTVTNRSKVIAHGSICGASFAPLTGVIASDAAVPADRLVYGLGRVGTFCVSGANNLFVANADGTGRRQLTHDGRSLNPVWGQTRIAFDRSTPRRLAPSYQIWLMKADGSARTQLTHTRVPSLLLGLVPLQFSSDGNRLLARFEGQDTSETWTIQVSTRRARQLKIKGQSVWAAGLSADGRTVLVDYGGFLNPASQGTVETLPFGGGRPTVLVRHASFPSWNR